MTQMNGLGVQMCLLADSVTGSWQNQPKCLKPAFFRPQPKRLEAYRFGMSVCPSVRLSVRHTRTSECKVKETLL